MRKVGIRELKARTAEILGWVSGGEHVIVTVRGREVARLAPIDEDPELAAAYQAVEEGIAIWGGPGPKGPHRRVQVVGKPVSETLLEDRR